MSGELASDTTSGAGEPLFARVPPPLDVALSRGAGAADAPPSPPGENATGKFIYQHRAAAAPGAGAAPAVEGVAAPAEVAEMDLGGVSEEEEVDSGHEHRPESRVLSAAEAPREPHLQQAVPSGYSARRHLPPPPLTASMPPPSASGAPARRGASAVGAPVSTQGVPPPMARYLMPTSTSLAKQHNAPPAATPSTGRAHPAPHHPAPASSSWLASALAAAAGSGGGYSGLSGAAATAARATATSAIAASSTTYTALRQSVPVAHVALSAAPTSAPLSARGSGGGLRAALAAASTVGSTAAAPSHREPAHPRYATATVPTPVSAPTVTAAPGGNTTTEGVSSAVMLLMTATAAQVPGPTPQAPFPAMLSAAPTTASTVTVPAGTSPEFAAVAQPHPSQTSVSPPPPPHAPSPREVTPPAPQPYPAVATAAAPAPASAVLAAAQLVAEAPTTQLLNSKLSSLTELMRSFKGRSTSAAPAAATATSQDPAAPSPPSTEVSLAPRRPDTVPRSAPVSATAPASAPVKPTDCSPVPAPPAQPTPPPPADATDAGDAEDGRRASGGAGAGGDDDGDVAMEEEVVEVTADATPAGLVPPATSVASALASPAPVAGAGASAHPTRAVDAAYSAVAAALAATPTLAPPSPLPAATARATPLPGPSAAPGDCTLSSTAPAAGVAPATATPHLSLSLAKLLAIAAPSAPLGSVASRAPPPPGRAPTTRSAAMHKRARAHPPSFVSCRGWNAVDPSPFALIAAFSLLARPTRPLAQGVTCCISSCIPTCLGWAGVRAPVCEVPARPVLLRRCLYPRPPRQ